MLLAILWVTLCFYAGTKLKRGMPPSNLLFNDNKVQISKNIFDEKLGKADDVADLKFVFGVQKGLYK